MKIQSFIAMKKTVVLCLTGLCLMLSAQAQGFFQASLETPPEDGARLSLGNIWFKVENGEVDFAAFLTWPGSFTSSLNPVLSVPGSSIGFSFGEAQTGLFVYAQQIARNPFLPAPVWVPAGYDCDGNPYYVGSPGVPAGNYYTGHFALPPGFLEELLAGNGRIEINSSISGNISVSPTPEPTTLALGLLGISFLLFIQWRRRAVG